MFLMRESRWYHRSQISSPPRYSLFSCVFLSISLVQALLQHAEVADTTTIIASTDFWTSGILEIPSDSRESRKSRLSAGLRWLRLLEDPHFARAAVRVGDLCDGIGSVCSGCAIPRLIRGWSGCDSDSLRFSRAEQTVGGGSAMPASMRFCQHGGIICIPGADSRW